MEDLLLLEQQLTADELAFRNKVRKFVQEKVISKMSDAFEQAVFPKEFIRDFAALGLFGLGLPTDAGGSAASNIAYGLVCQELEYGDSSLRSFISVQNSLGIYPIYTFGSEAQKSIWLPKMIAGEAISCFGLSELHAGSDPNSMQTIATKTKDGWCLNGSKMWITSAPIADIAIIWAKVEGNIEAFLIERGTPGFTTRLIEHKMSLRTSMTGEITLKDCNIPLENHLPGSKKGLLAALECLTQARYGIAWGVIGAAQACYDTALEYCKERYQFGRPLASFQLVQKQLVEMFTEISKAQCLNLQIGRLKDANICHYTAVSMAKMNACKQALSIARNARDLLGAQGITLKYPVIRHMQNLEAVSTYEGTDNIQHLILGRYLTGIDAIA
jgi:glutaryl-CoA dehydrogenase